MKKIGLLIVLFVSCLALTQPISPDQATSKLVALYYQAYMANDGVVPSLEEVKALIAQGADVNAQCGPNNLLLHVAVLRIWPDHVQALLEAPGIEVDKTCGDSSTALHQALSWGARHIAEMLLEAGANADAHIQIWDYNEQNRNIIGPTVDGSDLIDGTLLMYVALYRRFLIPILAPYARIDMTYNHPTLGPLTELERMVLCNYVGAPTNVRHMLLEGANVDHLSETSKWLLTRITGPDCCRTVIEGVISATERIRLHAVLKDPTDLAKRLRDLPEELPLEARENIDHALLNAVRNDLEESAKVLLQAGASPQILTKWLLRHQSSLSPVQQRFFDELRPSPV